MTMLKNETELSAKDKKEIEKLFTSIYFSDMPFKEESIIQRTKELVGYSSSMLNRKDSADYSEYSFLSGLGSGFMTRKGRVEKLALGIKFKENNHTLMYLGFRLASLMGFYGNVYDNGAWHAEPYSIRDLFTSLAVDDLKTVREYLNIYRGPYKRDANMTIKTLANTIFPMIMNENENNSEILSVLSAGINSKSLTLYEKQICECLKSIINQDRGGFLEHLDKLLKLHRRNTLFDDYFELYFAKPAHALYNLARMKGMEDIQPPEHKYWDQEFQDLVESTDESLYTDWIEKNFADTPELKYILLEPSLGIEYEEMLRVIAGLENVDL